MIKNLTIEVEEVLVTPGSYKKVSLEINVEARDVLDHFTLEEILETKRPDIEDTLDCWTMEQVLGQYDLDDIVQYCRDKRLDGLV